MRKTLILSVLSMLAIVGCQSDEQKVTSISNANAKNISKMKRELAQQLSQNYSDLESVLRNDITAQQTNIPVSKFVAQQPALPMSRKLMQADKQIRSWKGVSAYSDELLEVRLANEAMLPAWESGDVLPLFAYEPSGPEEQWTYIEAFDVYGNIHNLNVHELPDVPVLVIDNNSKAELEAGLKAMQAEMQKLGQATKYQPYAAGKLSQKAAALAEESVQSFQTTVLKKIHLDDDEEPWISGKAEIYALVTGVSPTYDEPALDLVEMPYLDYDNKDYFPNQIMIKWPNYRWGAADIILMEQDDGTNYKDLAKLLIQVAKQVMALYPETQNYTIIPEITNKIVDAIPDEVLTNDDDLVDIYYTLIQGETYEDHLGARANAIATFEPLEINPTQP